MDIWGLRSRSVKYLRKVNGNPGENSDHAKAEMKINLN